MTRTTHLERGAVVPRRLLFITEPVRAVVDVGLLASTAPLLAVLPRGDGHPVLVVPGLGGADTSTITLRAILRRLGYRVHGWRLGRNVGPTPRAVNGMRARLDDLTNRSGTPVSLIGWSLGGIYAGQLARRKPDAVRQVITLASPVGLARREPRTKARKEQRTVNRLYDDWSGFPQWPHWSEWGRWYAELQTEIPDLAFEDGPLPMPTTSIYSPLDGMVGWQVCLNEPGPQAENIAVAASHIAFAYHPAAIWAIADRLAQPAGQWAPFRPPPLLRAAYLQPGRQS
ncbi:MAG TPA: alpha/beta hydrolase [Mycobacterium sp.]|nr:alpha/beta hydrolase [Mycobacterium sp.]